MNNKINLNGKFYDKIYLDTCSIMKPEFDDLVRNVLYPAMKCTGFKITVPYEVVNELKGIAKEISGRGYRAKLGLEALTALHYVNLISYEGDVNATMAADNYFLQSAILAKADYLKPLYITQDFNLCKDLLRTNKIKSCCGSFCLNVKRINGMAQLEEFNFDPSFRVAVPPKKVDSSIQNVLARFGL